VPYWAALRAGEVNMRVGPSEDFPIEWVYRRQGLPVKVCG
jgi:SH3-like domain-containing protein